MKLRLATPDDKPRLIEMAVRFLLESPYGEFFDNQATPESIGTLIDNVFVLGAIILAELEPQLSYPGRAPVIAGNPPIGRESPIVGMLAMVCLPHPLTGRKYGEEIAWWVEPEHRGGLIGPKMLRAAEQWATTNGANMVKMVAPAGSDVATFYEAIGFAQVETAFIKRI